MGRLPSAEIGDGNGGTLDTSSLNQRDLLIYLHVKVDGLLGLGRDHELRLRFLESWRWWVVAGAAGAGLSGGIAAAITSLSS